MNWHPVESSNLALISDYDSDNSAFCIEFKDKSIYKYSEVPKDVYDGLMNAESKGRYLDKYIKKAGYPCDKMRGRS